MTKKLRGFKGIQVFLSILVMPLGFILWGLAAAPGILLFQEVANVTTDWTNWQQAIALGATLGIGALLWCLADLLMIGILGIIIRPNLDDVKAPTESWLTIRWGFFSLFHRLALPALKWMVPSFVGTIYYRMMGCKIGKNPCCPSESGKGNNIGKEYQIITKIGGNISIGCNVFLR